MERLLGAGECRAIVKELKSLEEVVAYGGAQVGLEGS